jgi:hypothetical protein
MVYCLVSCGDWRVAAHHDFLCDAAEPLDPDVACEDVLLVEVLFGKCALTDPVPFSTSATALLPRADAPLPFPVDDEVTFLADAVSIGVDTGWLDPDPDADTFVDNVGDRVLCWPTSPAAVFAGLVTACCICVVGSACVVGCGWVCDTSRVCSTGELSGAAVIGTGEEASGLVTAVGDSVGDVVIGRGSGKPGRLGKPAARAAGNRQKGRPHRRRVGFPPTGRPLDIGEQKRHHPRGSSRRHGIASAHCMCPSKPSDAAMAR